MFQKKGVGTRRLISRGFAARDGSAVKSHSNILQRLRRQISLNYYTIPPATHAMGFAPADAPENWVRENFGSDVSVRPTACTDSGGRGKNTQLGRVGREGNPRRVPCVFRAHKRSYSSGKSRLTFNFLCLTEDKSFLKKS